MPWSPEQADKHKKGLSTEQKQKWASIANRVLSRTGDESQAIRVASGAVSRRLKKNIGGS